VATLFSSQVRREFSHRRRLSQSRRALAEIRRYGVTSISYMSDDEQLEIFRELRSRDELTVRGHFRPHPEAWIVLARQAIRIGSGDDWIRLGTVKGHIDGIMGTSSVS
jgi:predicted amidohydrolase YtcJ